MRHILISLVVSAAAAAPLHAQSNMERGFDGALRGCEEWVLNPASWAQGTGSFVETVGLGDQMGLVKRVEDVNLPPKALRKANHYWRINSSQSAGYILVVSDQLPMCHITGGGDVDLQPVVERVLKSPEFANRWTRSDDTSHAGMVSTVFRNKQEPKFVVTISRADKPQQRLDRVQLLATAIYDMAN